MDSGQARSENDRYGNAFRMLGGPTGLASCLHPSGPREDLSETANRA
jgi:hypothetical protein